MDFVAKVKTLQNYFKAGNYKKVLEGCAALNRKFPNNSFILNLSGMAFQNLHNNHKAISFFELAIKADNSNIAAMNNMANSLKNIDEYAEAEKVYKKILTRNPDYINAYNNYANLKSNNNDIEGAIKLYEQGLIVAKKINSDPIKILIHLAGAFQSLNKRDKVLQTIDEIIKIDPNNVDAQLFLNSSYKYSHQNEETIFHIAKMEQILKEKNLTENQKASLSFAVGKAYDDLKEPEKAIKFILSANNFSQIKRKSNIEENIHVMNDIKNIFKDIDLSKNNKSFLDKKIIFICGMPRSGTTLTEQIISAHRKVYGAGELYFLRKSIENNFLIHNNFDKQKIINFQNSSENLIYDQYNKLINFFKINEKIITDKAPINFMFIGFIKIFFPNSKIIHCKRNPKDNCLSIYKNNFASPKMNWAFNQKDISNFYNNYNSMMNFWYSKMPEFIHTVEYEKLVSDKENEIKKLLNFCELDWDNNCLNFHKKSTTPIKTVSITQARQPIYKSSVNSYDNYKEYLKEMFENLI
jgi:tetratricopeptide (TPR) repeat protein